MIWLIILLGAYMMAVVICTGFFFLDMAVKDYPALRDKSDLGLFLVALRSGFYFPPAMIWFLISTWAVEGWYWIRYKFQDLRDWAICKLDEIWNRVE